MTTRNPILIRIDSLILDILSQIVDVTHPSSAASAESFQSSSSDRPSKRRKSSQQPRPSLTLKGFQTEDAQSQKKAGAISFPTQAVRGTKRFAQIMRVLELIQLNLIRGTVVTKRDIFYQSLNLFSSQQASDRIIEQVLTLLGCTDRVECGIVASPRGMLSGALTLVSPSTQVQVKVEMGSSHLIPTEINASWTANLACTDVNCRGHFVVVVEKEAVFKTLVQLSPPLCGGKAIIVTGKGYPDHATKALVSVLATSTCAHGGTVSMVGMFDGDPYGVDIHRQYSTALATRMRMRWTGVDVVDFLPNQTIPERARGVLVQLRNDERAKAIRLLNVLDDSEEDRSTKTRLTAMLLCGYKVELEAAYDFPNGGLRGYIEHKLSLYAI
nr:meiosis-specific topoisomerase [Pseudozyma thailandica]